MFHRGTQLQLWMLIKSFLNLSCIKANAIYKQTRRSHEQKGDVQHFSEVIDSRKPIVQQRSSQYKLNKNNKYFASACKCHSKIKNIQWLKLLCKYLERVLLLVIKLNSPLDVMKLGWSPTPSLMVEWNSSSSPDNNHPTANANDEVYLSLSQLAAHLTFAACPNLHSGAVDNYIIQPCK